MATLGYKPGSVADAYAQVGTADSLNQRATVSAKMTEHGWAYRRGIRGGRVTVDVPDVTLPLWATDGGPAPAALLGTTDPISTASAMLDATDGAAYTAYLQSAVMLRSGKRYALGFVAADARFGYGVLSSGDLPTGEYDEEYRRTVPGTPQAQDPFGATSTGDRGWIATWVDFEPNVQPDVPVNRSPSGAIPTLAPTFAGDFGDDNASLPGGIPGGDELGRYTVQLRVEGASSVLWSTTRTATPAERAARRFSVAYDGPALSPTVAYEWRCYVRDLFDESSNWSSWLLIIPGAGTVDASGGTPTGKQQTRQPGPFTGVWGHVGGLSADAAQVRILDEATDGVVRTSGLVALSPAVAPGGTISATWNATFGPGAILEWGHRYAYQVRAKDTADVYSAWSPSRAFRTNAAPSVPDVVTPLDGAVVSTRPVVLVEVVDPDDDQTTGLAAFCRVLDEDGGLLVTQPMAYDGARTLFDGTVVRRFRFALGPADLPTPGGYRIETYATDGTVYSGGNTTRDYRAYSRDVAFDFVAGPAIAHVSPADGASVATDTPTYDWSVAGQVRARVEVWSSSDLDFLIYDSGELDQTTTRHTQPVGFLDNGAEYYRIVRVWDASNQGGVSAPAFFSVDYSDPDPVANLVVSPYRARGDVTPTALMASWDRTTYNGTEFDRYVVVGRFVGDVPLDVDGPIADRWVRLAELTSADDTTFVYHLPPSGVPMRIGVKQVVELGGQTLTSPTVSEEGRVDFRETVICDARRGGRHRVVLPTREDRTITKTRPRVEKQPWNGADPVVFRTRQRRRVITADYHLLPTETATVEDLLAEIDAMEEAGGPLCYRDGRGRRVLGELLDTEETDPTKGGVRRITIPFLRTGAREVPA